MAFVPPDAEARRRAVGSLEGLPPALRRAFTPGDDFEPVPAPARADWLAVKREPGQSFERFARTSSNRPTPDRPHLYLQPLGEFSPEALALLERLQRFGSAFFVREMRVRPALALEGRGIAARRNRYTETAQLKTRDLLALLAREAPADACFVLGVTTADLYPHETWSFVFGEALLDERVGVFSVARYDPRFYGRSDADGILLLKRSCKVLAHEGCHMLGLLHCIYFNCLMNGSNHLAESDRRPLHLCPVDLRKLQWALGFDIGEHYRRLEAFWRQEGVDDEAAWIARRLAAIEDAG
jgi:archaemetzincin